MRDYRQIGEILVRRGTITENQLELALKVRSISRQRIGQVLISLGFATEQEVAEALAEQFGFDLINPLQVKPHRRALNLFTVQSALAHKVLPLKYCKEKLECALADPIDFPVSEMSARLPGRKFVLYVAPASLLMDAIVDAYQVASVSRGKSDRLVELPPSH